MKYVFRIVIALILLTVLQFNFLRKTDACGPSALMPVFDYSYAPERPWTDFASGKLGIIKPEYRRSVLFAAYRYLKGSGFSAPEQQALVETWEAQFNRVEPKENTMTDAVDSWVKARKSVLGDETKTPEIYTERQYGEGYDFFPNCTKNAFEVAAKTLADRAASYGSDNKDVRAWLDAQDEIFSICVGGGASLPELGEGAPDWLRKDRDYQLAAAAFYSTNYDEARERFANIAADGESPWHEVADYLVARTLVRRSSLARADGRGEQYNNEAEGYLNNLVGRASTYNYDARRLLNLMKFRNHPEERERELAQKLPFQNDPSELKQDLTDYSWLLDQLESEALKKEEARKEALKPPDANSNSAGNTPTASSGPEIPEDLRKSAELSFNANMPGSPGAGANANVPYRTFSYPTNLSDDEIRQRTETELGRSLTDAEKASIAAARRDSFYVKTTYQYESEYKGGYYGSEAPSLSVLPAYFGDDELTEWLFTYQIQNDEAYLHSLERWHQTGSPMWLMTAVTKTRPELAGFAQVMKAADEISPSSPAYFTIAYYRAKMLIDQNNKPEARKLVARVLDETTDMPVSTRNLFTQLRMKVSDSLAEFLASSTRRPFGFSYDDDTARTIDEIIAEQKSWYNAEYDGSQADYDAKIEQDFAAKKAWQDRQFFDTDVADVFDTNFPTSVLVEVIDRPELPDYLKRQLAYTIWTRAYLLKDEKTAVAMAPRVVALKPDIEPLMTAYVAARTPAERDLAGLYLLLKNGALSPYLQTGFYLDESPEPDIWQDDRWWCEQSDVDYDDSGNEVPKKIFAPPFLTPAQLQQARTQKAALKNTGDGLSYLSKRVMKWAATGAADKRLPEALYLIFQGNQWVKYSCGDTSDEIRAKAGDILKTRYPRSRWTAKMFADLRENEQDSGN
jgi:hypothetical protein